MTKIKAVIIDDEPRAIDVIKRYCEDSEKIEVVATFRNPVKALDFLQENKVPLLFLDINMPKINGMEFLKILPHNQKVIFTTAYSEYALDSYNFETIDYLLKPIDFKRFLKAISKAKARIESKPENDLLSNSEANKTIFIKSGPQLHKINIEEITYLEKDGNYLVFHTREKKILSRQNMKDIFDILDPEKFIRIHKSYVVALQHIEIIEHHQVIVNKTKIPVGRNFRENLPYSG